MATLRAWHTEHAHAGNPAQSSQGKANGTHGSNAARGHRTLRIFFCASTASEAPAVYAELKFSRWFVALMAAACLAANSSGSQYTVRMRRSNAGSGRHDRREGT